MELESNLLCVLMVVSGCTAVPLSTVYGPPPLTLNVPQRFPELGMTPQYEALVYRYIANLAGYQNPPQIAIAPSRIEDFGVIGEPAVPDLGDREPVTESSPPLQPSHLLPSDFVILASNPESQFYGHFDAVNSKKISNGLNPTALPPIGGVLSNFIIQRNKYNENKVKRQTFAYSNDGSDDGVVINAAERVEVPSSSRQGNCSNSDSTNSTNTTDDKEEPQPSVAQSKPQAIAVAGPGGVAQAAPVATAVVGKNGLAIAAPSATAVAGRGAQAAVQGGEEKMSRKSSTGPTKNA